MSYTTSKAFTPPVGTQIAVNTGTPTTPVWLAIAEVTKIGPSGRKIGVEKTTNLSSVAEEKLGTIIDSGKMDLEGNYLGDTTQEEIETLFQLGVLQEFQFTLPGLPGGKTLTWTFYAIISGKDLDAIERDKAMKFKWSLDISNLITIAIM